MKNRDLIVDSIIVGPRGHGRLVARQIAGRPFLSI